MKTALRAHDGMAVRHLRRVMAVTLSGALVPIATNVASSNLPRAVQPYLWLSWLLVRVLLGAALVLEEREGDVPPLALPDDIVPLRSEEVARLAAVAYGNQRFLEAFNRSVIAVDRLHDYYCFYQFRHRQPSAKDARIAEGLTSALGAARSIDPSADVRSGVSEAAARLRDIVAAAQRAGLNSAIYRQGLIDLRANAPDIEV